MSDDGRAGPPTVPAWSLGADPANTVPTTVVDALMAGPKPPKTVAVVTNKFPSIQFMTAGAREVLKKRGLNHPHQR